MPVGNETFNALATSRADATEQLRASTSRQMTSAEPNNVLIKIKESGYPGARNTIGAASSFNVQGLSPATAEIVRRVSRTVSAGTPGWEAAREQVLKNMVTSDTIANPISPKQKLMNGRETNGHSDSPIVNGHNMTTADTPVSHGVNTIPVGQATPTSNGSGRGRSRGRGRGRGSARGRGRGRGGGRGGKRKRDEDEIKAEDSPSDEDDEDEMDDYTPTAAMTKSGRSVQKPTSFVPPPQSPAVAGIKRKRTYNRKNPENTVCNTCLRPHSPATNSIVFCDGCNTPYHRYCHHPPIPQTVVDVPEMEWYCSECKIDKQPDIDVQTFVSGEGVSDSQKRAYLSTLPQPTLVNLILQGSNLHPDLPIFAPHSRPKAQPSSTTKNSMPPPRLPHTTQPLPHPVIPPASSTSDPSRPQRPPDDELENIYDDDPPAHYPKPGHGLAATLPPEEDDLHLLVDDNHEVYSHIYQTDPEVANKGIFKGEYVDDDEGNGGDGEKESGDENDVEGGAEMAEDESGKDNDDEVEGMDMDTEVDAEAKVNGEKQAGVEGGADANAKNAAATEQVVQGSKGEADE